MHDDLRALSLNGLAARGYRAHAERHHVCDHLLLHNSTADTNWRERCMTDQVAARVKDTAGGATDACTLSLILQRAWCSEDYQSIGNL